jgi:hypothetical protein
VLQSLWITFRFDTASHHKPSEFFRPSFLLLFSPAPCIFPSTRLTHPLFIRLSCILFSVPIPPVPPTVPLPSYNSPIEIRIFFATLS